MKNRKSSKSRRLGQFLYVLSLLFLAFGLFSIGWVVWPVPREAVTITLPAGVLPGAPVGATFASLVDYTLNITWPRWLRAGEDGTIWITLSEDEVNVVEGDDRPVQIVLAESILGSLSIEPSGQQQASMGAGQNLELKWAVSGSSSGVFPGEVIVSFGFYDQDLSELVPVPVAVVDIEVNVIRFLGMKSQMGIWLGLIGLAFWGALFLFGRFIQTKEG